jgi:tRNA-splicing ligase RtcB
MRVLEGGRLPVYSWAPDLEEGALRQACNCTQLTSAYHHVAVMADGHQGYGVPIGAVLALQDAIAPYAVGNDIGCGMALMLTDITRSEFLRPVTTRSGAASASARDDVMGWVQSSVPSGHEPLHATRADAAVDTLLDEAFDALEDASAASGLPLSSSQSTDPGSGHELTRAAFVDRGRSHAGTLGAGNHFVEVLAGPDNDVWVLVHSGSRGVGGLVCANFHRMALAHSATIAPLPDPGLAWLPIHTGGGNVWSRVGSGYERALRATLGYAEANRGRILDTVTDLLERRFPGCTHRDRTIDIHHNDATLEEHFGQRVWVHRKGAVKADHGATTITPGSMGTATIVGRGLGNADSFRSCSHGAGRVLSRGRARRELSLQTELAKVASAGGKVFAAGREAVLDEMPGAYKDLDAVMAHQSDLVEPVLRLTPLATYKGAERARRRGRRRPADER